MDHTIFLTSERHLVYLAVAAALNLYHLLHRGPSGTMWKVILLSAARF